MKGGDNWYRSLGPKQPAVFNHQTHTHTHTRETRRLYVHPYTKKHTQFPSFVVSAAKLLFPFCTGCFYLSGFVPQSLNEGQYVRKREFTQTRCAAAQRNIKDNH